MAHVRSRALDATPEALRRVARVLPGLEPAEAVAAICAGIRAHARITLDFHPDRLLADGRTVAEGLAADGIYRSQYETGISNGSRTAFPGGQRDGCGSPEDRCVGPRASPVERPAEAPP